MKDFCKHFKIGRVHVYVSSGRMKRRRSVDEKMRNQRKILQRKKKLLYSLQDGKCPMCDRHLAPEALEIHHVVGVSDAPGLSLKTSNLVLLCHACHVKVHQEEGRDGPGNEKKA